MIRGTADEIALKPNYEAIYESLTAAPKRDLIWVEGAKHYLTPGWIAETYAKRIAKRVGANYRRALPYISKLRYREACAGESEIT